mmetsp:Transcript_33260/g.78360  ORF Transcript_33260/g.78360 Transcript_33260/m.78360 type:complete len:240 (-) Transcript_33260:2391-3110(-)
MRAKPSSITSSRVRWMHRRVSMRRRPDWLMVGARVTRSPMRRAGNQLRRSESPTIIASDSSQTEARAEKRSCFLTHSQICDTRSSGTSRSGSRSFFALVLSLEEVGCLFLRKEPSSIILVWWTHEPFCARFKMPPRYWTGLRALAWKSLSAAACGFEPVRRQVRWSRSSREVSDMSSSTWPSSCSSSMLTSDNRRCRCCSDGVHFGPSSDGVRVGPSSNGRIRFGSASDGWARFSPSPA